MAPVSVIFLTHAHTHKHAHTHIHTNSARPDAIQDKQVATDAHNCRQFEAMNKNDLHYFLPNVVCAWCQ